MKRKYWVGGIVALLIILGVWMIADSYSDKADKASESAEVEEQGDIVVEEENHIPADIDEEYLKKLRERYSQPTLVMGDVKTEPGEEASVLVLVVNNPGILGMCGTLSYDESVMSLEKVENGKIFKDVLDFTKSKELKSGCRFLWDGVDIESKQIMDGEALQMIFKIKKSAKKGKYPIKLILDKESTINRELTQLDLELDCGYITID